MYEIFESIMAGVETSDPVSYISFFAFVLVFLASFFRLLFSLFRR